MTIISFAISVASAAFLNASAVIATPAGGQESHGLIGHYYLPSSQAYVLDQDGLPVPKKAPDATRTDPQIAFGAGKGFSKEPKQGQRIWWAPPRDKGVAVVWKGYVRLPKAGTYYFATASDDGSSVYLNQSRVALNAHFGGALPSDLFAYNDPGAMPTINPAANTYVVPVSVTAPRVLPIEVRYIAHNASSNHGFGIDLYWVTPDAKRDQSSKPIAELIPTEALFIEPPIPIEPTVVSRPHSTISSDFLYLPFDQGLAATLTVRLADQQGRPVAGRQVHVSGLADYGKADAITQPEKLTDANGITTAMVKGYTVEHTATFFATDLTDLVDVAQTAEINITRSPKISFLPPAYSPYYDPKIFHLAPMPIRVGQPTTISVPLMNHQKTAAQIRVRFLSNEPNIGLSNWTPIGESETVVLQPGETRVVSITWTPASALPHLCFKVEVWGDIGARVKRLSLLSTSLAYAADAEPKLRGKPLETRQQNVGRVCQIPKENPQPSPTPQVSSQRKRGFLWSKGNLDPFMRDTDRDPSIRDEPSPNARKVGKVRRHYRFIYDDVLYSDTGQPMWYHIHSPRGTSGWISAGEVLTRAPWAPPADTPIDLKDTGLGLKTNAASVCAAFRG